jgi:hypothetical protein
MKSKSTQILFHVIGCAVFLLLPILFWHGEGGINDFFSDYRAVRGYLSNILILLFFYLIYYYLIPKFYFQKKYLYFILILLGCYLVISLLPGYIMPVHEPGHFQPGPGGPGPKFRQGGEMFIFRFAHDLVLFLAVVFFSLLLNINNRWKKAEKAKLKAELSYFKAQINPHFLFNTLNTIYSLAIQKAENTPEAVVKLSGMMRYVIADASSDYVSLEKEMSYVTDYIDLQKIRFGDTAEIDYIPCEPSPGLVIAPLILIPFIENAFKYGVNPGTDSSIGIRLSLNGSELHMKVTNKKVNVTDENEKTGGLGIINARQRLALLYPDKHQLIIDDGETDFTVDLYIMLP